jgi:ABC-type antimicrobial peptide transport system permease subunit
VALGARVRDITGTVMRGSVTVAAAGAIAGVVGAVALARQIDDLLFGVAPHDAAILAGTAVTLVVVAVTANWLPARRAARIDPMLSLRGQ